jgi:hypothetical protein
MATRVLRELVDGWVECEDGQGVFYHNTVTKESTDIMPPQLNASNKILRELPGGWLECEDAQGVYYYNSSTGESSVSPPASLMPAQLPASGSQSQVKVLRELPGTWLECEDAQGIFYFNQVTKQSSATLPVENMNYPTQALAPTPAPAASGNLKVLQQMEGNWLKCQDNQGIFYVNALTKQTSNDLPAELNVNPAPQQGASASQPKILQELPNNWQKCQDEQGIFYFNKATQQFSESVPPDVVTATLAATGYSSPQLLQQGFLGQQQKASQFAGASPHQAQVSSYQQVPKYQNVAYQNSKVQQQPLQQQQLQMIPQQLSGMGNGGINYAAPVAVTTGGGARKKLAFGEWIVYEDQMGDFFVHVPTSRQFERPPEEMVRSYQAYKAAGLIT